MKYEGIEMMATQYAASYMRRGYRISTKTAVDGSVDLARGNDLIRVCVRWEHDIGKSYYPWCPVSAVLYVLRFDLSSLPKLRTVYFHEFEAVESVRMVQIVENWFVQEDEAEKVVEKRDKRIREQVQRNAARCRGEAIPKDRMEILLRFARKQKGMKSVTEKEIVGRRWVCGKKDDGYYLIARGKKIRIS